MLPNDIKNKLFHGNIVSNDDNFKLSMVILGNFESIMIKYRGYCEAF